MSGFVDGREVNDLTEDWRNTFASTIQGLDQGLSRLAIETAREARANVDDFTGELRQGIQASRLSALEHAAESTAGHAEPVEIGRPKGFWPNRQNIKDWIRLKPVTGRAVDNESPKAQDRLAYLISRKIFRDGIEAKPYMQPAQDKILSTRFDAIMNASLERATQVLVGGA